MNLMPLSKKVNNIDKTQHKEKRKKTKEKKTTRKEGEKHPVTMYTQMLKNFSIRQN